MSGDAAISIIVPAYNATATLKECLAALVAAAAPNDELIVSDDGSTDLTRQFAEQAGLMTLTHPGPPRGPAYARNVAARAATNPYLLFVDADVVLARDTPRRLLAAIQQSGAVAAFGSYDDRPRSRRLTSLYANLRHHFVHQHGSERATTFWSGIGLIDRQAFLAQGGFDETRFPRPSIEDVELGFRLTRQRLGIRLVRDAYGTHLKDWTLGRVWHSDILSRAVPWSRLIAEGTAVTGDLNLARGERISAALALALLVFLLASVAWPGAIIGAVIAGAAYGSRNRDLFHLLFNRMGPLGGLVGMAMHWCYHLYATASFVTVLAGYQLGLFRRRLPLAQQD